MTIYSSGTATQPSNRTRSTYTEFYFNDLYKIFKYGKVIYDAITVGSGDITYRNYIVNQDYELENFITQGNREFYCYQTGTNSVTIIFYLLLHN